MKLQFLLALAVTLALPARAGERAGVRMPDQISAGGKTLVLNGLGVREATFLKVDVYVAGLYLEEKSSDPDAIINAEQTRKIVMEFVRKVKKSDITEAWNEGFEKNGGSDLPALGERLAILNSWMPELKRGDTMAFTYLPGEGVEVEVNGASRGKISGEDFARVLWSIWLGPHPPNKGLRKGMLGLG